MDRPITRFDMTLLGVMILAASFLLGQQVQHAAADIVGAIRDPNTVWGRATVDSLRQRELKSDTVKGGKAK